MERAESSSTTRRFERELAHELLKAQRMRASLAVILSVCTVVLIATIFILRTSEMEKVMPNAAMRWILLIPAIFYVPILLLIRHRLDRSIKTNRAPLPFVFYLGVLFEVSVPTIGLILFAMYMSPIEGMHSPIVMFYPVVIVTWAMTLKWRLCIFAGLVGSVEYFGLFSVLRSTIPGDASLPILTAMTPTLLRAFGILSTGLITALVAHQLKRRVITSLQAAHEQTRVRQVFGQHVSPEVVDAILAQGAAAAPESRHMCVMFLDIRGFTTFSEQHTPEEVVAYLDRLIAPLLECVTEHKGVVNKLLGDGFMALFGVPVPEACPEASAVKASLAMLAIVEDLVAQKEIPPTKIGIGLHAGSAITGSVGSARRKEYTVIGDTVNLAARIEGLNKQFNSQLLASASVMDAVEAAGAEGIKKGESLGDIEIRGRAETAKLYKLA